MASDDAKNYDDLLAEVESSLSGKAVSKPVSRQSVPDASPAKRSESAPAKASRAGALTSAVTVAAVAAGAAILLFALVPFVGAFSAAWGAAVAAFVLTLWSRLRGR